MSRHAGAHRRRNIAGFAEARNELKSGRSAFDLAGEVMAAALEQTGITKDQIKGFAVCQSLTGRGSLWRVREQIRDDLPFGCKIWKGRGSG